ncbi:alpha-1,4-L-rhamnosidase [Algibacter lectus]|uniref:alpha-1,4-L-rhamnosidase n=1 Tax=Algibacter lectus TaxID=221126 RepID=UPI002495A551|nr:alpha-1,4-L-rhamnosidase [Algibacter lectus]
MIDKKISRLSKTIIILFLLSPLISIKAQAQIVLETDFTNPTNVKQEMRYHLNVFNRITPLNGVKVSKANGNSKICIVRPLGGIASKGKADITKDSYKWGANSKKFYTDFTLLKKQIDGVFNQGLGIHQIVLDNPSWAFQRNEKGELIRDSLKISTYGNAEPPRDYKAWGNYLKDVMAFLVETYGEERMLKTQFDIGREIGTPTHWSGTKAQFFEFYKVSITAIREVLPKAKVGTHFLWGSSNKAWGIDFVKWSKANKVHYDFVGVSFYPFYDKPNRTNFKEVYAKDFAVIKDIPEWDEKAKLEMHEYALIKSLSKAGNSFVNASEAHQNSFIVGLMKMFYENNMQNVFQWGQGTKHELADKALLEMQGNIYYKSKKKGAELSKTSYVDAIFSKDVSKRKYNILAYNYNANPKAAASAHLKISAKINIPPGTKVKVRSAVYNVKEDLSPWSKWREITTNGNEKNKSNISFEAELPVFSFLKYEVILSDSY